MIDKLVYAYKQGIMKERISNNQNVYAILLKKDHEYNLLPSKHLMAQRYIDLAHIKGNYLTC